jgi:ribose 5-phosphate isomerase B
MRRFDIITEADARRLEVGETVELTRGGHITPLAHDTLRERRVTVVRLSARVDTTDPAFDKDIRAIVIGSDHTGVSLKRALAVHLRGRALAVREVGAMSSDPVDYPDVAAEVARAVAVGEVDAGIVIDGAGLGSAITANKVKGIRAAMCTTPTLARYAREHNGANVLALGATLLTAAESIAIVEAWLAARLSEPRYIRRLAKIRALEEDQRRPDR